MYFYNVLPTKNMGQNLSILLYSSQKQASVGDIVDINIRNTIDFGLILSENLEEKEKLELENSHENQIKEKTKKFEIKEINKILPVKLSRQQIQFLKIFTENTFNSLNDTWDALTIPFGLLTQKQWLELEKIAKSHDTINNDQSGQLSYELNSSSNNFIKAQYEPFIEDKISKDLIKKVVLENNSTAAPKVEFLIDLDIKVRIMYIIRSLIHKIQTAPKALKQGISEQLLVVFPEKKYLNKIYKYLQLEINKDKELSKIVELLNYVSEPTKRPKECIWSMLNFKNEIFSQNKDALPSSLDVKKFRIQIICSTRSGLFLPFSNLANILLIDEGNSMYIQDQNSLYYDTREAIFLISKAFNANISFISPLPSIRLYNMYNKQALEKVMIENRAIAQNAHKIKITRFDKKSSKYDLFGWEIEQILEGINK